MIAAHPRSSRSRHAGSWSAAHTGGSPRFPRSPRLPAMSTVARRSPRISFAVPAKALIVRMREYEEEGAFHNSVPAAALSERSVSSESRRRSRSVIQGF